MLSNKVALILITSLITISFTVAYLLFTKDSDMVSIENHSQSYKLAYKRTDEFAQFIDNVKYLKVAGKLGNVKNLNRISKVVMVLGDRTYPVEDRNMPLAAIQITTDNQRSKESTLVLNLMIDQEKAKKFSDKQLSNQVFIDSISIIYNLTHADLSYSEKIKRINSIITDFYRKSANPFQITRKNSLSLGRNLSDIRI